MKTKTKQTNRTGTESEKWTSHGGISVGRGKGGMGGNVQGRSSIISRYKIDGKRLKNGIGDRGLKELICTTHGHELRWGGCCRVEGSG